MSEPVVDAERLAALLDSRLDGAARAEVLAQLAASASATAELAAAAAVLRELETAGELAAALPQPALSPTTSPQHRWTIDRATLVLAAAVVLAVVGWGVWTRSGTAEYAAPAELAVLALAEEGPTRSATRAVSELVREPTWATTRGASNLLTPAALAVRAGARLMALELAVRSRDTAAARLAAADATTLLGSVPGATPIADLYRRIGERAAEPPDRLLPLLTEGWDAALQIVDEDPARLGAWLAAAQVAAARRDDRFFQDETSRRALERAAAGAELSPEKRGRIARIRTAATQPDWAMLDRDLTALLRELGS